MASIYLYSTEEPTDAEALLLRLAPELDLTSTFQISRTIGPANYFELSQQADGSETLRFPNKDIRSQDVNSMVELLTFLKPGSSLSISPALRSSEKLMHLCQALTRFTTARGEEFSVNSLRIIIGPTDLVRYEELDDDSQEIQLMDISQVALCFTYDSSYSRPSILEALWTECPEFVALMKTWRSIVGSAKLFFSA